MNPFSGSWYPLYSPGVEVRRRPQIKHKLANISKRLYQDSKMRLVAYPAFRLRQSLCNTGLPIVKDKYATIRATTGSTLDGCASAGPDATLMNATKDCSQVGSR